MVLTNDENANKFILAFSQLDTRPYYYRLGGFDFGENWETHVNEFNGSVTMKFDPNFIPDTGVLFLTVSGIRKNNGK